ncbi:MAG: hypothetical protein JWR07_3803, partial [Nevskia sp.]|nr:hypothetical protein [Nevskia sp.]
MLKRALLLVVILIGTLVAIAVAHTALMPRASVAVVPLSQLPVDKQAVAERLAAAVRFSTIS